MLRICRQIRDELADIVEEGVGPLKLVINRCGHIHTLKRIEGLEPRQNAIMMRHGGLVSEVTLHSAWAAYVNLREILIYCTSLQKLVVDAKDYPLGNMREYMTEDWWLNSNDVPEWLWPLWKEVKAGCWSGAESSELIGIVENERWKSKSYSVNFITAFEMSGREHILVRCLPPLVYL